MKSSMSDLDRFISELVTKEDASVVFWLSILTGLPPKPRAIGKKVGKNICGGNIHKNAGGWQSRSKGDGSSFLSARCPPCLAKFACNDDSDIVDIFLCSLQERLLGCWVVSGGYLVIMSEAQ